MLAIMEPTSYLTIRGPGFPTLSVKVFARDGPSAACSEAAQLAKLILEFLPVVGRAGPSVDHDPWIVH